MINKQKDADFSASLAEMDSGLFLKKLSLGSGQVAIGAVEHSKKAKITMSIELEQIGESAQVMVTHKFITTKPTALGKITQEESTTTPMYVNKNGFLSVAPDVQVDLYRMKEEELSNG